MLFEFGHGFHSFLVHLLPLTISRLLELLVRCGTAHVAGGNLGVVDAPVGLRKFEEFEVADKFVGFVVHPPAERLGIVRPLLPLFFLLLQVIYEFLIVDFVKLSNHGLLLPAGEPIELIHALRLHTLIRCILVAEVKQSEPPFLAIHSAWRSIRVVF